MIESLNVIRLLGLAPVFEELYFGRADPARLLFSMSYPDQFRGLSLKDCEPLTSGGLIPLFSDDNFYDIYFYDPTRHKFIVKFLEEPDRVLREFDTWQQFLAYKLLEVAETGPSDEELKGAAETMGFKHTAELLSLLRRMEGLSDIEIDQLEDEFIRACAE
jgi:hypothetical protein